VRSSVSAERVVLNCFKLLCIAFLKAMQIYESGVSVPDVSPRACLLFWRNTK